jgi:hypothetical protein
MKLVPVPYRHFFCAVLLLFFTHKSSGQTSASNSNQDSAVASHFIQPSLGNNDTLVVKGLVIDGELIGGRDLSGIEVWGGDPRSIARSQAEWTRLRNAVYVCYPYAKKAGFVMNDINSKLVGIVPKLERKQYIKSREKELRSQFSDKIMDLSIYQGKVLMKLINRETGNNCFEIIKEMKGGFTARFYQTIMFFVGSDLKQAWNPEEDKIDRKIELIVQEIERMYRG